MLLFLGNGSLGKILLVKCWCNQFSGFKDYVLSDSYFSLLKFEKPDEDLNLKCLAGKFAVSMNYIKIFPVDCDARLADA